MSEYAIALYDAFSDVTFGGSIAGVVSQAQSLDAQQMQMIAREVGAPATGFITGVQGNRVEVRFFSTLTEYPMCGHGTLGLMTWLVENRIFEFGASGRIDTSLRTSGGTADVEIRRQPDGRPCVMLHLSPPGFERAVVDEDELAALLGVGVDAFAPQSPLEITRSEFTHLIAPIRDLDAMRAMRPNFTGIADFSRRHHLDTVAVFTLDTIDSESTLHCREFCPAVGTPEAPASGTTNRALACYLVRHSLVEARDGELVVIAEQGYEMGRPSRIRSELTLVGGQVQSIRVGGLATKTLEGRLLVPSREARATPRSTSPAARSA